jgi:hypothetical protein
MPYQRINWSVEASTVAKEQWQLARTSTHDHSSMLEV